MEPSSFLETLKGRFEAYFQKQTLSSWEDVELSLTETELQKLALLESRGGEPDVYKEDIHYFYFGELAKEVPSGPDGTHRNLNYSEAVKMADALGAKLMSDKDYSSIRKPMDEDGVTQAWVLSDPEKIAHGMEALQTLGLVDPETIVKGMAAVGSQGHGGWNLIPIDSREETLGFRCVIKILRLGKLICVAENEDAFFVWPTYDSFTEEAYVQNFGAFPALFKEEWEELVQETVDLFVKKGEFQTRGSLEETLFLTEKGAKKSSMRLHHEVGQMMLSVCLTEKHRIFLDLVEELAHAKNYRVKGSGAVYNYWRSFKRVP